MFLYVEHFVQVVSHPTSSESRGALIWRSLVRREPIPTHTWRQGRLPR